MLLLPAAEQPGFPCSAAGKGRDVPSLERELAGASGSRPGFNTPWPLLDQNLHPHGIAPGAKKSARSILFFLFCFVSKEDFALAKLCLHEPKIS